MQDTKHITPEQIASRVEEIAAIAWDFEVAHGKEDRLWEDVLTAIAGGYAEDVKACAFAALQSRKVDFQRVCA